MVTHIIFKSADIEGNLALGLRFFEISNLTKSCILMQMGSENHNMTSNVENLTPTLVFETRRRRLKFGVVLRILV